jgi:3-oxoacyl-[acyl-carrier-protein] synthase III
MRLKGLSSADLNAGDLSVTCSFGAGYAVGSLVLRRV